VSRRAALGQSQLGLFLRTIGLLTVACTLVMVVACAIGYALSKDRTPIVFISPEAADYAGKSLFADERQMAAFTARLQSLADETKTSVAVTYIERPRLGETLAAAMERAVQGLETQLAGRSDDYQQSMLVIVLMGKPRIFGFVGSDHAGTRVFLRNLSGDPAVHSLNFKHIQVTHGHYLMQALAIAQEALRPLNVFLEHHPAQGLVVQALEIATSSVPELPGGTLLAIVQTVRAPLVKLAADYRVPPITLLIVPLVLMAFLIKGVEWLANAVLKPAWLKTMVWLGSRIVNVPIAGIVAVILYGSLENIASLSQMSGQPLLDLLHLSRSLPAPTVPVWLTWLALPAAYVITLGIVVGVGLRMTGGNADQLAAPRRWFAKWPQPLRFALQLVALPLVLVLPAPFMVALSSMEGLMSVALLVTMLIVWGDDVRRFWETLGDETAEVYA
jgi:hypothetical protein